MLNALLAAHPSPAGAASSSSSSTSRAAAPSRPFGPPPAPASTSSSSSSSASSPYQDLNPYRSSISSPRLRSCLTPHSLWCAVMDAEGLRGHCW
jgi:hypothetical protein